MKINTEELNKILDMQKQVEEFKNNFIKEIEFYEMPFCWYDGISEVTVQRDGLKIEYFNEDNNIPTTVFLPWEYFNNKEKYIQKLEKEWEEKCKENAKNAAEARLKLAQEELEKAKKLKESYQTIFEDNK